MRTKIRSCSSAGVTLAGLLDRFRRPVHRPDRGVDDLVVETLLPAEVVVDGRDVGAGAPADLADGDLREAALGEQPRRDLDETLAGLEISIVHGYSVRLKSSVAAVIATTEKIRR